MNGERTSHLLNEEILIARIRSLAESSLTERVVQGIGDDCAVIDQGNGCNLLITTDAQVEEVHFRRAWTTPEEIGRKALAVNISDIAAMGGTPTVATVSLILPEEISYSFIEDLYSGMLAIARKEKVALVGGNIARTGGPFTIDVTLLGESAAGRTLFRSGASAGDSLYVTGWPGLAGAGLRALFSGRARTDQSIAEAIDAFVTPPSMTRFARNLAERGLASAAIDTSDGLAHDLRHLCKSSGLGVLVETSMIPLHPLVSNDATDAASGPVERALCGGEDYALLFAVKAGVAEDAITGLAQSEGIKCHRIGTLRPQEFGYWMLYTAGENVPLPEIGWDHFTGKFGFHK